MIWWTFVIHSGSKFRYKFLYVFSSNRTIWKTNIKFLLVPWKLRISTLIKIVSNFSSNTGELGILRTLLKTKSIVSPKNWNKIRLSTNTFAKLKFSVVVSYHYVKGISQFFILWKYRLKVLTYRFKIRYLIPNTKIIILSLQQLDKRGTFKKMVSIVL